MSRCGRTETFARKDVQRIDFSAQATSQKCESEAPADLPAGVELQVLVLDFIDSAHESASQTFRGKLAESVMVNGRVIASKDSRLVLRLVPSSEPGRQILDIVGIEQQDHWAELVPVPGGGLRVSIREWTDLRKKSDPEPILVRGARVRVPSNILLVFRVETPQRLKRGG